MFNASEVIRETIQFTLMSVIINDAVFMGMTGRSLFHMFKITDAPLAEMISNLFMYSLIISCLLQFLPD